MTLCIPISPAGLDAGIICPVLRHLSTYNNAILSDDARAMLLRVAAAESELQWLEQHGGPARSYWQIEHTSALDVLYRLPSELIDIIRPMLIKLDPMSLDDMSSALVWNPWAACAIARAYWWLDPNPMPPWQDAEAQGEAWKRYWNTHLGAGTPEGFRWKCHETGVEDYIAQTFGGLTA